MHSLYKKSCDVPYALCRIIGDAFLLCNGLVEYGNKNLVTDIAIAALMLESAFFGAKFNVYINLKYIQDEKYIDMATAISGSGPAYIFLIMEALTDAAVHIGLPRKLAEELVTQTVLGSAYMSRETGKHPAELKNMVTSPGGTTAEGLLCLEEGGVRAILAQAVIAAYEKAQRLGGQGSK
jgi:pyrroline-5-carboxylate reductase